MGIMGWIFIVVAIIGILGGVNYLLINYFKYKRITTKSFFRAIPILATGLSLFIIGFLVLEDYYNKMNNYNAVPKNTPTINEIISNRSNTYIDNLYTRIKSNNLSTASVEGISGELEDYEGDPEELQFKYDKVSKVFFEIKENEDLKSKEKLEKYQKLYGLLKEISDKQKNYKDVEVMKARVEKIINTPEMKEARLVKYQEAVKAYNNAKIALTQDRFDEAVEISENAIKKLKQLAPFEDQFTGYTLSIENDIDSIRKIKSIALKKASESKDQPEVKVINEESNFSEENKEIVKGNTDITNSQEVISVIPVQKKKKMEALGLPPVADEMKKKEQGDSAEENMKLVSEKKTNATSEKNKPQKENKKIKKEKHSSKENKTTKHKDVKKKSNKNESTKRSK